MASATLLPSANRLHVAAYRAREASKRLTWIALVVEAIAALLTVHRISSLFDSYALWTIPIAGCLLIVAIVIRQFSDNAREYSEQYRTLSLNAVITNVDIDPFTVSTAGLDSPSGLWLAIGVNPPAINEYYRPHRPPGPERMRELYAGNAFWTCALLKTTAKSYMAIAIISLLITLWAILRMGISPTTSPTPDFVLELFFPFVLVLIFMRSLQNAIAANQASQRIRGIADTLIKPLSGDHHKIEQLARTYDIATARTPYISTLIYNFRRTSLGKQWDERRKALNEEPHELQPR